MKRNLLSLVLLFLLPLLATAASLRDEILTPTVEVETPDLSRGAGVIIKPSERTGYMVLTARHVVEHYLTGGLKGGPTILFYRGRSTTATVKWAGEKDVVDLALLALDEKITNLPFAVLANEEPDIGEEVWYCGHSSSVFWNLERSIVNQYDDGYLVTNGNGWFGNSGGGLFVRENGQYRLAGIVVVLTTSGSPKSPIGCIRLRDIRKAVDEYARKAGK